MMESIGHLIVHSDGVEEEGVWRGRWTIEKTNRDTPGQFSQVTDGETLDTYSDRTEAQVAAREIGVAKARELYAKL